MSMMESEHTGMLQYSQINHARTKAKIMTEIEWILIAEAAEIMDMHVESVRRLCRKENPPIRCRQLYKHGPWQVAKADAQSYEKPVGGRPREQKLENGNNL